MNIRQDLQDYISDNGLSQSAVARAVGVTSPVVNQYLHGKYPGNVQEIERKIAAYAKSVGKWFQTDDATRLQYLALALESVTGGFKKPINWKTMDNSFLMLTPELLREIMQTTSPPSCPS